MLSTVLKHPIHVYQAAGVVQQMGAEFDTTPLKVRCDGCSGCGVAALAQTTMFMAASTPSTTRWVFTTTLSSLACEIVACYSTPAARIHRNCVGPYCSSPRCSLASMSRPFVSGTMPHTNRSDRTANPPYRPNVAVVPSQSSNGRKVSDTVKLNTQLAAHDTATPAVRTDDGNTSGVIMYLQQQQHIARNGTGYVMDAHTARRARKQQQTHGRGPRDSEKATRNTSMPPTASHLAIASCETS